MNTPRPVVINDREYVQDWKARVYRSGDGETLTFDEFDRLLIRKMVETKRNGRTTVRIQPKDEVKF